MSTLETDRLLDQLNEAKDECAKARQQIEAAKSRDAMREAEEELNFWQDKMAMLPVVLREVSNRQKA